MLPAKVLDAIRADEHRAHDRPEERRCERKDRIRTLVELHRHVERENAAVIVDGGRDLDGLGARGSGRRHVLDAILDPLDGAAQQLRGGTDRDVLARDAGLLAEGAADIGRDHAKLLRRLAEQSREQQPQRVRRLRRRVVDEIAGAGMVIRDAATRLHRHWCDALGGERLAHDARTGERRVRIAELHALGVEHVRADVLEQGRSCRILGLLDRRDGVEDVVFDDDRVARVLRHVAAFGQDQRDRIADVAHLVGGERGEHRTGDVRCLRPELHRVGDLRELRAGDDRHDAVERARLLDVEIGDATVRDRAAQEDRVHHPRQPDVVDIATAAAEDLLVLDAPDALAGEAGRGRNAHTPRSAASRIPWTMLS